MTIEELTTALGRAPATHVLLGVFLGVPALAWLLGAAHGRGRGEAAPYKYVYAVLVYLVSVPGMCAAVLTGYMLFFTRRDLMQVNAIVFLLPVASMVASLIIMRRSVEFQSST
jgi:hypothetical protein